jgi:hypothetical protein
MKRVCSIILLALCGEARAELRFTPQTGIYELDGFKFERVVLYDGSQRITYSPPLGWHYSGQDDRLILWPPHTAEAEAVVSRKKVSEAIPFDEEGMKRLTDEVLASLPPGARQVNIVSQIKDPVIIEHKSTYLCVVEYERGGSFWARSVLFLNRNATEELRFQLTSRRGDFPKLAKAFHASHFTWQNL